MLPLEAFLQELCKIAGMYDAMPPPASPQATALARLPGPGRLPSIDQGGAIGASYKMHAPTVLAGLQASGGARTGTIPSPAPHAAVSPTMQAPAPNHLGAPISTRGITTPMTHMPTVHPASGMVGAAEQAVSKLRKPISGVVQRVARAV